MSNFRRIYPSFIFGFFLSALIITSCKDELILVNVEVTSEDFTACINEEIRILGEGFSNNPAENIVKFGDVQAEVLIASTTELILNVPAGAVSSRITVKTTRSKVAQGPFFTLSSADYYIKFKANGESKIYSTCIPTYNESIDCMWSTIWNNNVGAYANMSFSFLTVCYYRKTITPEILQNWNGDQLLFAGSDPIVAFGYKEENGDEIRSDWADKTGMGWPDNESELNITSVTELVVNNETFYVVSGNFKCFASTPWDSDIAITEGQFNLPFLKR